MVRVATTALAVVTGGALAVLVAGPVDGVWLIGAAWLAFALGAWLVHRVPVRTATALILLGGIGLPLAAGFAPPRSSDDMYRYIWDGRVQASGTDPYRYAPDSPELVPLRDDFLWPAHATWCVPSGCSLINRPAVHTIYPPVAEGYFVLVHLLSPARQRELPLQLAATGMAFATTILLLAALRRLGADPRRAVLWAWCPAIAYEAGSNAHVDVLAAGLAAFALFLVARGHGAKGGAVLGLAIATKLTPVLLLPAVLRRRPVAVLAAAVSAVAVVYLPHVLAVGGAVLGYLPGYLAEEGYSDGARFALLSWLFPQVWAAPLAVALLAAVGVWVLRTADPDRPWRAAATMTGAALLVAAPAYPWYALLLVVLVALGARAEWLAVAAAGYLAQFAARLDLDTPTAQRIGYGAALTVVGLVMGVRALRSARSGPAPPAAVPARPATSGRSPRTR